MYSFQYWQFMVAVLAGWVNREQQAVIEYLRTENQVLREQLGPKRLLLSDDWETGKMRYLVFPN